MYFEGELPVMTYGNNCNSQNNGWNDWSWIIGLALVGGLFGGWGNGFGGFGGGGRGYGFGGVADNYTLATDFATIERKLDGVNNGLCDGFYAQNTNMLNGFASVQQTLCQGFNGIERSIADTNSNLLVTRTKPVLMLFPLSLLSVAAILAQQLRMLSMRTRETLATLSAQVRTTLAQFLTTLRARRLHPFRQRTAVLRRRFPMIDSRSISFLLLNPSALSPHM